VRVATWNVNGLRARFEFLLLWLKERAPDLVGLQELKLSDDQFPHADLEAVGYRSLCHGQKAWNGVAILSREPLEILQRGLPGQEEMGARLITARLAGLDFTTVYCPNGKDVDHADFERKLAWYDALRAHLDAAHEPGRPGLLCGDFNVCPSPLDSWHGESAAGEIFHTDEERARFGRLIDWGLFDPYRALHPDGRDYSWWDYRGGAFHRGHGLRIDFVLATRPLRSALRSASVDRDWRKKRQELTASDHAPVSIELDL
jgi:exodeoxyribonuclease-3